MKTENDLSRHPQDIIVENIINKICVKSHGENWDDPTGFIKKELSPFDKNLK